MRPHPKFLISPPKDARKGAALVIILAFLVLLTGMVLAFFSRAINERQVSNSSVNQTKADLLARSALKTIIGDLKQEIVVGSTSGTGANGISTYKPLTNANIVPVRSYPGLSASNDPVPNLIRESGTSASAITVMAKAIGVGGGAMAVSSTTASLNGRSINLARWNSHYMIPRTHATDATIDTTPIPAFTAPAWVLVTGSGPAVLNQPDPSVVGRYAYAIYDEGGMLDVNVAGYPSSLTPAQAGEKGLLSFADLTQIPVSGTNTPFPLAQIDNLVGWRNYATCQPGGSLSQGFNFDLNAANRYLSFLVSGSNSSGFLSANPVPWTSTGGTPRTDQMFTSRQELLKFWNALIVNSNGGKMNDSGHLQNLLPYLGTFSRELNAPSWSPATPAGSTIDYAGAAESSTSANRNIPNVRYAKDGTITRYRLDGTSYAKNVRKGDSLVQMRFPLGRIAWLTPNGPKQGIPAEAILQHFGLAWDANNLRWEYVSPLGSLGNPAAVIKTLDQVSQECREPDFFETLKAGILAGSLGKTQTDPSASPRQWKKTVFCYADTGRDDVNVDLQVIRIGANIIDQATPGSIPTDIRFTNNQVSPPVVVDAFGIKSLPYIAWIPYMIHRPERFPARNMIGGWFTFKVWDPHQNAGAGAVAGAPVNFRIHPTQGTGLLRLDYSVTTVTATGTKSSLNHLFEPEIPMDTSASYINFTRDLNSGPTYSDPTLLQPGFATATGSNDTCTISVPPTIFGTPPGTSPTVSEGSPGFVGFNVGLFDVPDSRITGVQPPAQYAYTSGAIGLSAVPSRWPCFEAQLQDPSTGNWRTYQQVINIVGSDPGGDGSGPTGPMPRNVGFQLFCTYVGVYNVDPRTERFGAFGGHDMNAGSQIYTGSGNCNVMWNNTSASGPTLWGNVGGGPGWPYGTTGYPDAPQAQLSFNTLTYKYADPDGVYRDGDAARNRFPMVLGNPPPALSSRIGDRPVILGRPFRSVGELGYAFRDMPWKTVDFYSKNSADSALLDLFTTSSDVEMTAGKFNLNTRNAPVLQTMLANAITTELALKSGTQSVLSPSLQAAGIASAMVKWTGTAPLLNRSDLVPMFADPNLQLSGTNLDIKTQREVAVRALSEAGSTRAWNLFIDIIAQSGRFPKTASSLSQFNVDGEHHYWLHVAIDRFTGEVIDQQLEEIYE